MYKHFFECQGIVVDGVTINGSKKKQLDALKNRTSSWQRKKYLYTARLRGVIILKKNFFVSLILLSVVLVGCFNSSINAVDPFVEEVSGYEWNEYSIIQKRGTIAMGLKYLADNGIIITEDENFYVEALDKVYADENASYVPIAVALKTVGGLTETMEEPE